ncbi:hypothetical protein CW693_04185, partial [Candidatus Bathyarchaeota archaeon]
FHCSLRLPYPQNYFVEREGRKWTCNCPHYRKNGFCSHVCAVMILESLENAQNSQRARLKKAVKEFVGHG